MVPKNNSNFLRQRKPTLPPFYCRHVHIGRRIEKIPLMVPDYQMDSLKLICAADVDNTIVSLDEMPKFEKEQ